MEAVFEKIKERLEERLKFYENRFAEMSGTDRDVEDWGSIKSYKDAIEIVNQVAEEYLTNDGWIPVTKELPKFDEIVQITYISCIDRETPFCDGFAFYKEGEWKNEWRWSFNSSPVNVEVVAWRRNCKPYRPKGE